MVLSIDENERVRLVRRRQRADEQNAGQAAQK
jgi:hypothetical protein